VAEVIQDRLPEGVERVRAPNAGFLTLSGTNTYLVGSPAWVVDPGPDDDAHVEQVLAAVEARGGIEGIVLTHRHLDHAGAAPAVRAATGAPLAVADTSGDPPASGFREPSADGLDADVALSDGDRIGPFEVIATPGHSPDHLSFLSGTVLFCGDTVLGEGSVFIPPGDDSMREYFETLRRLAGLDLSALCPGHGPIVWNPREKLEEYIEHRLDRERRLVEALDAGVRTQSELLDAAWSEVPRELRPAAALTLEAHLEKLGVEGRLPAGVERLRY
jgi:glyoxylase-like metal-dependent hydrolase (beta-lactamase superfamily II)